MLPGCNIPAWQHDMLSKLSLTEFVSLSVVAVIDGGPVQQRTPRAFRRWKRFDQKAFRNKLPNGRCSEDLAEADLERLPGQKKVTVGVPLESIVDIITGDGSDVVVWLVESRPPASLGQITRFGIWTLPNATSESTGFWELADRIPVTSCTLISLAADPADDRLLASAFAATDLLSLSRSLLAVRAKDQTLLMTMLRRVHESGALPTVTLGSGATTGRSSVPGTVGLLWGLAKLYGRYALSLATRRFYYNHWQIAYRRGGDRLNQDGLIRFAPNHKGFWADPFVASWEGRTALFFEEMPEGETRGNIVVSEFGKDGSPGPPQTIIQRDYHLSYPFVFEYEGDLFMTPESADANRVEAFRCVEFPGRWEPYAILLDGIKAYDPTLIEHNGRWWMFVSVEDNGNSSADELHLFHAPDPFGEWVPHPQNPINADVRSARPGGALYRENGELIRPAQDCSVRYGYGLSIQKILRMTEEVYEEEEVCRILPDWAPNSWGTHTVNQAAGITVYDSYARRRK